MFPYEPKHYAFPLDGDGRIREDHYTKGGRGVIATCDDVAMKNGMTVIHPRPSGLFVGQDYVAIAKSDPSTERSFLRDKAMVPSGTKLFHRGKSVCKVVARWNSELAFLKEVDIASPIATLHQYVFESLESPRLFSSSRTVEEMMDDSFCRGWHQDVGRVLKGPVVGTGRT